MSRVGDRLRRSAGCGGLAGRRMGRALRGRVLAVRSDSHGDNTQPTGLLDLHDYDARRASYSLTKTRRRNPSSHESLLNRTTQFANFSMLFERVACTLSPWFFSAFGKKACNFFRRKTSQYLFTIPLGTGPFQSATFISCVSRRGISSEARTFSAVPAPWEALLPRHRVWFCPLCGNAVCDCSRELAKGLLVVRNGFSRSHTFWKEVFSEERRDKFQ